ncbi:MAG: orotate phosphoribosyltransferase [Symbiobacteriaceae bacterium]|jgi:orotate phosphoribosyltransferase|nr:orotate phosphoribosyltransferase [Symbiobacteriaceae bacterium]
MNREELFAIFEEAGVYREGHFVLTSGRHSGQFFLLPHLFQFPALTERVAAAMAAMFDGVEIETVVGPATGGIVLAYEVARQLGARRPGGKAPRAIFTEKTDDGKMALKRQWSIRPGEKVLVVEDAVSTGGSVLKAMEAIRSYEPDVVAVACIADRSGGAAELGAPLKALVTLQVESWAPEGCPLCAGGVALVKPKA